MANFLEAYDCLFNDFGEEAIIERTGESITVKHQIADESHSLGLAEYKKCSAIIWLKNKDDKKILPKDILTLQSNNERYEVINKYLQSSGLIKVILKDAKDIKKVIDYEFYNIK